MRPSTAFGTHPEDVLIRVANITRLAMDAVRGINLQLLAGAIGLVFHLVDCCRAVVLARVSVFHNASPVADIEVRDPQMQG